MIFLPVFLSFHLSFPLTYKPLLYNRTSTMHAFSIPIIIITKVLINRHDSESR